MSKRDHPNSRNVEHSDCKYDDCTHPKVVCRNVVFKKCVKVEGTLEANRVSTNTLFVKGKSYLNDVCISGTTDINGDVNLNGNINVDGDVCIEPGKKLLVDDVEEKTPGNGVNFTGDIKTNGNVCVEGSVQTGSLVEKVPGEGIVVDGETTFNDTVVIGTNVCVEGSVQTGSLVEKVPGEGIVIDGETTFNDTVVIGTNVCVEGSVQTGSLVEKVPGEGIVVEGTVTLNDGLELDGDVCIEAPNKLLVDTIEGKTTPNTGTVYGVPITNGLIPVGSLDSDPLIFRGCWNADTNDPTLTSGVGTNGDYYIVCVAGNTVLDGQSDWEVGDGLVFEGNTLNQWVKIENMESVVSVNGQTGVVVLNLGDLNDVVLGALAIGQTIVWDGANWVNQSLALTTLASSGGDETLVNDGVGPALVVKGLSDGTGISLSSDANQVTVTNTGVLSLATRDNAQRSLIFGNPAGQVTGDVELKGLFSNTTDAMTDFGSSLRINNQDAYWNANEIQSEPVDPAAPVAGDYLNYDGAQWVHTPLGPVTNHLDFAFRQVIFRPYGGAVSGPLSPPNVDWETGTGGTNQPARDDTIIRMYYMIQGFPGPRQLITCYFNTTSIDYGKSVASTTIWKADGDNGSTTPYPPASAVGSYFPGSPASCLFQSIVNTTGGAQGRQLTMRISFTGLPRAFIMQAEDNDYLIPSGFDVTETVWLPGSVTYPNQNIW